MRRLHLAGALAAGIGICAAGVAPTAAAGPKTVVGPDRLVSRDGNFPHAQLILATNPKDAKNDGDLELPKDGAATPQVVNPRPEGMVESP